MNLFTIPCEFRFSATNPSNLPPPLLPEIAFYGRSNVGKSSLLNALVGRRSLARTSNTPGRTQQINFFEIPGHLFLVDLPGYGYAKACRYDKNQWKKIIDYYLINRCVLKRVFLLIDGRHGFKPNDEIIMTTLDQLGLSYQIVVTKADKVAAQDKPKLMKHLEMELIRHPAAYPSILLTSTRKKQGIEELRHLIELLLEPETSLSSPGLDLKKSSNNGGGYGA